MLINTTASIVNYVCVCYSVILLIAGYVLKVLSICILSRRTFRGTSMSIYLNFLALIDPAVIFTGLPRWMVWTEVGIEFRAKNLLPCWFISWMSYIFLYSSSWTLVAVTTERVIAISKPHSFSTTVHLTSTKLIVLATALTAVFETCVIFFILGNLQVTWATNSNKNL